MSHAAESAEGRAEACCRRDVRRKDTRGDGQRNSSAEREREGERERERERVSDIEDACLSACMCEHTDGYLIASLH